MAVVADIRHRRDTTIPRWLKRSIEAYHLHTGGDFKTRAARSALFHPSEHQNTGWGDLGTTQDNVSTSNAKHAGILSANDYWHLSTLDPTGTYSSLFECGQIVLERLRNVTCTPQPDAFNPCEDVMGFLWLRIIVWFVVCTALFGNLVVLVITLCSRFKLTVPKFLMCNLAFADLSLGVYLLMLASIDLHTMGVYFARAITWQNEGGCQVAGFLAIFATSLSVFTLTVITLERWYAISHAIHLTKRLRLRQASTVMVCGWMYAAVMAAFPLLGVSSYGKTSICLPMETSTPVDRAFVLILLISNAAAFMIICGCYIDMYRQVRGNNTAARRNDANIAKRMSVLVFTDFICLFPIAFFGLTAAAGTPFITVTDSKILLVFFFPFNSCANPFLYAIFTKQFHKDLFSTLDRLGICRKKAAKYGGRLTYASQPMSMSHSRNYAHHIVRQSSAGSVLTSYLSDVHRSSKASLSFSSHETSTEPKGVSPKNSDKGAGSPKLISGSLNSCPSVNSRSIELPERKDTRKLSVVREVSQTSDEVSDIMDEPHAKDKKAVRSVSEYADDDIVSLQSTSACGTVAGYSRRHDRRKPSQTTTTTCSSCATDITQVDSVISDGNTIPAQDTIEEEDSDLADGSSESDSDHDCSAAGPLHDQDAGTCRDHRYRKGVHTPETRRLLRSPPTDGSSNNTPSEESESAVDVEASEKLGIFDPQHQGHTSPLQRSPIRQRSPLMKQTRFEESRPCDPNQSPKEDGVAMKADGYINTSYCPLESPLGGYKEFNTN